MFWLPSPAILVQQNQRTDPLPATVSPVRRANRTDEPARLAGAAENADAGRLRRPKDRGDFLIHGSLEA